MSSVTELNAKCLYHVDSICINVTVRYVIYYKRQNNQFEMHYFYVCIILNKLSILY